MKSFNQIDRRVAQSLTYMQGPEMRPLLEFLVEVLEDTKDAMILAESEKVARLQGRAGVLKEFVDAVHKSAETLERLR